MFRKFLLTAAVMAGFSSPAAAQYVRSANVDYGSSSSVEPASVPYIYGDAVEPIYTNNIAYVTGGVDQEERGAIESVRPQYNFRVMNSEQDGAFVGRTTLNIYNNRGDLLLMANAGPLFYARLAPGTYNVRAESEGQFRQKTVRVPSGGAANMHFVWY